MAESLPLSGLRVVAIRPPNAARALCRTLERDGAEAVALPLQEIEPVVDDLTIRERLAAQEPQAHAWIFTSQHAVQALTAEALAAAGSAILIAIGPATEEALKKIGASDVVVPQQHNSEGVLALPVLQDIQDKIIVLFTGEAGRGLLQQELTERASELLVMEVYRRRAIEYAPHRLDSEVLLADALLLSNGESIELLAE